MRWRLCRSASSLLIISLPLPRSTSLSLSAKWNTSSKPSRHCEDTRSEMKPIVDIEEWHKLMQQLALKVFKDVQPGPAYPAQTEAVLLAECFLQLDFHLQEGGIIPSAWWHDHGEGTGTETPLRDG